jgi:hypothetical protein
MLAKLLAAAARLDGLKGVAGFYVYLRTKRGGEERKKKG